MSAATNRPGRAARQSEVSEAENRVPPASQPGTAGRDAGGNETPEKKALDHLHSKK